MTLTLTGPNTATIRHRLEGAEKWLAGYIADLEREYFDWSPDLGIPTVRDHLWAIAESERSLLARLTGRSMPTGSYSALDVPIEEILKLLESCNRNVLAFLGGEDLESVGPTLESDAMEHLERKAHHVGAIAVLLQLIDPERRSSLRF